MGSSIRFTCKNCDYQNELSLGIGMMYPDVCEEELIRVENGERGEEVKQFFENNDDAAVSCELVPMQCEDCGELDRDQAETLYASYPVGLKPKSRNGLTYALNKNGEMKYNPTYTFLAKKAKWNAIIA